LLFKPTSSSILLEFCISLGFIANLLFWSFICRTKFWIFKFVFIFYQWFIVSFSNTTCFYLDELYFSSHAQVIFLCLFIIQKGWYILIFIYEWKRLQHSEKSTTYLVLCLHIRKPSRLYECSGHYHGYSRRFALHSFQKYW
jgi:hypothetical protein